MFTWVKQTSVKIWDKQPMLVIFAIVMIISFSIKYFIL